MEKEKLSLTIDEAAEMMGVGRNMMLKIAKIDSFPAIQFEKKIIINKKQFVEWFDNVTATFAKYNPEEKIFEPWPSLEENQRYLIDSSSAGINSVLGFEIDTEDNLYILDQGKINNTAAQKGSTKLIKYSLKDGKKIKEYIFNETIADPENSFLNDVVIDTNKNRAYITDSGIALDGNISHYKPGIIVLDLNNPKPLPKAYSNRDSESFKAISDRIYGYYSHEKRSMIHSYHVGSLFMQMNTYWSAKKNQYAQVRSYT